MIHHKLARRVITGAALTLMATLTVGEVLVLGDPAVAAVKPACDTVTTAVVAKAFGQQSAEASAPDAPTSCSYKFSTANYPTLYVTVREYPTAKETSAVIKKRVANTADNPQDATKVKKVGDEGWYRPAITLSEDDGTTGTLQELVARFGKAYISIAGGAINATTRETIPNKAALIAVAKAIGKTT
jgi:hypothetical protein